MNPFPYYNKRQTAELLKNVTDYQLAGTKFERLPNYVNCISPERSRPSLLLKYFQTHGIRTPQEAAEIIMKKFGGNDNGNGDVLCPLRETIVKCKLSLMSAIEFVRETDLEEQIPVYRQGVTICIERRHLALAEEAGIRIHRKNKLLRPGFEYKVLAEDVPCASLNNEIVPLLRIRPGQMDYYIVSRYRRIRRMIEIKKRRQGRVVRRDRMPSFLEAVRETPEYKSLIAHV